MGGQSLMGVSSMTTHPSEESESNTQRSPPEEQPAVLAGSRLVQALRAGSSQGVSWVRNSALYGWLTAEPDPDVIVIDLRETWTVGPVLSVLDWVVGWLVEAGDASRAVGLAQRGVASTRAAPLRVAGLVIALVGLLVAGSGLRGEIAMTRLAVGIGLAVGGLIAMQDTRDWATLRETRPVELMIAALEPPDPPVAETDEPPAHRATDDSSTELSQGDGDETIDTQQEQSR